MLRLLQFLQTTSTGASLLQTLMLRSRVPDVKRLIVLLALCQIMVALFLAAVFYGVYCGLQYYAAYGAGTSFLIVAACITAFTLLVLYVTHRKCCSLQNSVRGLDFEKRAVRNAGDIVSAFMEGFRADKRSGD